MEHRWRFAGVDGGACHPHRHPAAGRDECPKTDTNGRADRHRQPKLNTSAHRIGDA